MSRSRGSRGTAAKNGAKGRQPVDCDSHGQRSRTATGAHACSMRSNLQSSGGAKKRQRKDERKTYLCTHLCPQAGRCHGSHSRYNHNANLPSFEGLPGGILCDAHERIRRPHTTSMKGASWKGGSMVWRSGNLGTHVRGAREALFNHPPRGFTRMEIMQAKRFGGNRCRRTYCNGQERAPRKRRGTVSRG